MEQDDLVASRGTTEPGPGGFQVGKRVNRRGGRPVNMPALTVPIGQSTEPSSRASAAPAKEGGHASGPGLGPAG